jgi:hypothetical protein
MSPTAALALAAYFEERGERSYMKTDEPFTAVWRDFPTSVMEFPKRVMELFPGPLDQWLLLVLTLTVVGLLAWKGAGTEGEAGRARRRLRWMLIMLGLAWLSLPYNITKPLSWWYVSPRLPSLMAVLFLCLPAIEVKGARRLLFVPLVACAVVLPLKLTRLYAAFSARNASFMRLVAEIPNGAPTMVVMRGMMRGTNPEERSGDPSTSAPVYWHFTSWPMALRGGYGPYVFDQGIPVRFKRRLKAPQFLAYDNFDIRQAPEFEFYLVRLAPPVMDREPALRLIDEVGEWKLYQRTSPLTDEP